MEKININKISVDEVWELLWKAWDLAKVNYKLTMVMVLIYSLSFLFAGIPYIGVFLMSVIGCFTPLLFYKACIAWEKGEPSSLAEVFSIFQDKKMLNNMRPLMVLIFLLSAVPSILEQLPVIGALTTPLRFLLFPASIIAGMAYPIMFFNQEKIDLVESLTLSFNGLTKNIIPFIVGGVLMVFFVLICTIALVLPLFFIAMPIFITYHYLWYRIIYEDLVLEVKKDENFI